MKRKPNSGHMMRNQINKSLCSCLSLRCSTLCSALLSVWVEPFTAPVCLQPVWLLDPSVRSTAYGHTPLKNLARECLTHQLSFSGQSGKPLSLSQCFAVLYIHFFSFLSSAEESLNLSVISISYF